MKKILVAIVVLLLGFTFITVIVHKKSNQNISTQQIIDDEEVIFTKAQIDEYNQSQFNENKKNEEKNGKNKFFEFIKDVPDIIRYNLEPFTVSEKDIENLKTKNEKYLKYPIPKIDVNELERTHERDNKAAEHKNAILNNKNKVDDCYITTFTDTKEYFIWCENNPNYAYGYESIYNPILIGYDITKIVNKDIELSYQYKKRENNIWELDSITISYPFKDLEFMYSPQNNKYELVQYYWGDDAYYPDGSYVHSRDIEKL